MNLDILIVSYNTCDDLRRCLQALLNSGAPPDAIRIGDNASTDGTRAMLARDFPQIPVRAYPRNMYYARVINDLAADTHGSLLLLLNPDTEPDYRALCTLARHFAHDPQIVAVAPQLRDPGGPVQASCRRLPDASTPWRELRLRLSGQGSAWKMADFDHQRERDVEQPMFSCILIRRSGWEKVGPLDPDYPLFFNDVDWCARAQKAGGRIRFDPAVAVPHRLGGTTRQYPWRRHWRSHASFARYIRRLDCGAGATAVGLLGVAVWFIVRLPAALLTRR